MLCVSSRSLACAPPDQVRSNILRALGDLGFLFPKIWIDGGPGRAKLTELLGHVMYNTTRGPAKVRVACERVT